MQAKFDDFNDGKKYNITIFLGKSRSRFFYHDSFSEKTEK